MGKAKTTAGQVKEMQVGKEITDAAKKSNRFYTEPVMGEGGKPIFYFQQTGDFLKGRLASTSQKDFLHYSNKTYIIEEIEQGRQGGADLDIVERHVEEILAYRDLRRIIEQNELMLSVVRIVLAGKVRTTGGHYRYVWEVWEDTGIFYEQEEQQAAKPPRKRTKKGDKRGRKKQSAVAR